MKNSIRITFLLILIFIVIASTVITAETHRDLFGDGDFSVPAIESMGYQLHHQLIYPDEANEQGFVNFRYMNEKEETIVACNIQFYGSEYKGDPTKDDDYVERRNAINKVIDDSATRNDSKYYEYYITSENDVAFFLKSSGSKVYNRNIIELPIVAWFNVVEKDDNYDVLVDIMNNYIDEIIIEAKALSGTNTTLQDETEETEESEPEETINDTQEEQTEEKTIKVRGRLINYDISDVEEALIRDKMISESQKQISESLLAFFKAPSPDKLVVMSISDFDGNELGCYGPIITGNDGRFEFEYPAPMIEEYDLFIVMPLANFPEGKDAGPSIGVKDWVYTGGTQNSVIIQLEIITIETSDKEKEIDLGDLYVVSVDSPRFIQKGSQDTDFVNGFIYSYSYLYALYAEQFYKDMVGYELSPDKENPLIIYHNANRVMPDGIGGNYDHIKNYINLSDYLSTWFGMTKAKVAVFHEFSHKVMFDMYGGKYPSGDKSDWLIGIYGNQSTAHSLTEGFAYFMQNAISEYYGGVGTINESPVYGHIEPNFPAWFEGGLHEARAVSGVLYDLYDQGNFNDIEGTYTDDDTVTIPLKDLVNLILKSPLDSVGQLYDKLVVTYPNQKIGIDNIFIEHGFFSVEEPMAEGLGVYHKGEAFVDANRNFKYDDGEAVINFNALDDDGFRFQNYEEGSKIGYAAYSNNNARQMQVTDPKFWIKTNATYPVYGYDITFIDTPYLNYSGTALGSEGYVQMPILPYNHNIKVVVYPAGQLLGEETVNISSSEIKSNYTTIIQQGYLAEWHLEDPNQTSEYLPPLISALGGDYDILLNIEPEISTVLGQLSDYEFGDQFIEIPYIRPPELVEEVDEVIEEPVKEVDVATEEPLQLATESIASNEQIDKDKMDSFLQRWSLVIGAFVIFSIAGIIWLIRK
jgi:hypothetical protein